MLHANNYYQSILDPTKISPPPGFYPPAVSPTPQPELDATSDAEPSVPLKSVPSPISPRFEQYGNHSKYAYAAGKLLATVDFNISDIRKWAVLDSGATGNFLVTDAPMIDKKDTHVPLSVTLPDGSKVQSSHVGKLDIPQLPKAAREGHVITGLNTHSLMSVVVLCNAGCVVKFTKIGVTVKYRGRTVLTGSKCTRTGLWMVPLAKTTINTANLLCETPPKNQLFQPEDFYYLYKGRSGKRKPTHQANSLIPTSTKSELARYYHQCIGSPPNITSIEKSPR